MERTAEDKATCFRLTMALAFVVLVTSVVIPQSGQAKPFGRNGMKQVLPPRGLAQAGTRNYLKFEPPGGVDPPAREGRGVWGHPAGGGVFPISAYLRCEAPNLF